MENRDQILIMLGEIKGAIATFQVSQADHETRIRVLETNATRHKGMFAGITLAASTVASAVALLAHMLYGK